MCKSASFHAVVRRVALCAGLGLGVVPLVSLAEAPGYYGYGSPATAEQIAGWDIDVRPDGKGYPPGSGTVQEGAQIYQVQCASCHGTFGEAMGRYPALSGGEGTLTSDQPEKTIGSYWPYVSTLWDYIHRAMPFYAPQSLSNDQVYALVAYILNLNYLVDGDFVADAQSLTAIELPNADGFVRPDPRPDTHNTLCMTDCKNPAQIKITSTAEGKNLTPATSGPLDEGLTE